jgi:hypothetical protein
MDKSPLMDRLKARREVKPLEPYEEDTKDRQRTKTDFKVTLPESKKGQAEDEIVKEAGISSRTKPVKHICVSEQCRGCPYHDTGPDPFGKVIIHWCGPWEEPNGDTHWWNIAELAACPKGKWGDVSRAVH